MRKLWRKIFFEIYWYPHRVRKYKRLWLWSSEALRERRRQKRLNQKLKMPRSVRCVNNSKAKIKLIGKRDGEYCRYCGSKENLTIDHVIPVSICKINESRNWQILCYKCNQEKGDTII
jgi:5-methylcytosine-specific restriction endonuclease McrA